MQKWINSFQSKWFWYWGTSHTILTRSLSLSHEYTTKYVWISPEAVASPLLFNIERLFVYVVVVVGSGSIHTWFIHWNLSLSLSLSLTLFFIFLFSPLVTYLEFITVNLKVYIQNSARIFTTAIQSREPSTLAKRSPKIIKLTSRVCLCDCNFV